MKSRRSAYRRWRGATAKRTTRAGADRHASARRWRKSQTSDKHAVAGSAQVTDKADDRAVGDRDRVWVRNRGGPGDDGESVCAVALEEHSIARRHRRAVQREHD